MKALQRRGYWAGVALAAPFLAQFVFWELAVLLVVPFIASVIATRPPLNRPPPVLMLAVFLAMVHVLGLYFTSTPFAYQVVRDLCIFALLLGVFLLAGEDATDGFFAVIVPLGVATAVLGLVKMAMLDRGYLFKPLLDSCSSYPAGTSFCVDYNILGLLWLLAIIGAMKSRWWFVAALLVAAGMLVGSRRFILLAPFLPIAWVLLERKKALLKVAGVAVAAFVLTLAVTDSDQYMKHQKGVLPWSVVDWTGVRPIGDMQGPNRTYAGVMLGTMGADSGYGAGARIDRWKLGVENLNIAGSGFDYHTEFSCKFVECQYLDHPHMPVVSEWLIGGVLAGLAAVGFYAGLLWAAWKRREVIPATALLVTMPFALISGDTVFSLPQMMSVGMVVLLRSPVEARCPRESDEPGSPPAPTRSA
jgi:hypothetical protein